jgi:hypothetical protein
MDKRLILALTASFSAAAGALAGYKVAVQRLNEKYNILMEDEIARTRAYYAKVAKADEYETPADAAEALGIPDAVVDAVKSYSPTDYTKFANVESVSVEVHGAPHTSIVEVEKNVFDRDPEVPYLIDYETFMADDEGFEQHTITFFAGDGVLSDDQDMAMSDDEISKRVGVDNLLEFGNGTLIFVRNEKLKTDFEITKSTGSYGHEVAGLQHSDATFEPIRRRRSADE